MSAAASHTNHKLPKPSVDYREGDDTWNCRTCRHRQGEDACLIVAGEIDPRFWCKRWTED